MTAPQPLRMFIPLTKVDAEQRLVYGLATGESLDRSGEICDYATTKPYYEKWSSDIAKASGGKSLGNLRAMHGKVAAGKVTSIGFNDDAKQIEIAAKVVDDGEWKKVEEGVYTGFSQGGGYVKRWTDGDGNQRYTADPSEVSLVDLPCLETATFQVIKSAGAVEERRFAESVQVKADPSNADVMKKAGELAKAAGRETEVDQFFDKAREALRKAVLPTAPEAPHSTAEGAKSEPDAPQSTPPNPGDDVEQVWRAKDGTTYAKKAEAIAKNAEIDAAAAVAPGMKPVLDAIDKLGEKFGVEKKDYSDDDRKAMADKGHAMSDGSFPIANKADLENAISAYGRAKDKDAAKKHISARAKALDATDMLPEEWTKVVPTGDLGKAKQWIVTSKGKDGKPNQSTHDTKDDAAAEADKRKSAGETDVSYATKVAKPADEKALKKGLYGVARLANLLSDIQGLLTAQGAEEAREGDSDSELPDQLKTLLSSAVDILRSMVEEETTELLEGDGVGDYAPVCIDYCYFAAGTKAPAHHVDALTKFVAGNSKLTKSAELIKAGARNSKSDAGKIQAMHDTSVDLGATCGADKAQGSAELTKALASMTAERNVLQKTMDEKVLPMLQRIADTPMPLPFGGGPLRVVDKGGAANADAEAELAKMQKEDPDGFRLLLHKVSLSNPQQMVPR